MYPGENAAHPSLTIAVKPHEDMRKPGEPEGNVFVTSLIRIPKDSLPEGTDITAISLVGA